MGVHIKLIKAVSFSANDKQVKLRKTNIIYKFVLISNLIQMVPQNFNSLYTTFYKKSLIYVKSYIHNEVVSEDIVSESLIKLWVMLQKESEVQIAPLLFKILKNGALDYLKHEKTKMSVLGNISELSKREIEFRLCTLNSSDPNEVFSTEVTQIVQKTLDQLPKKDRRIFEMSRFEGKPYKEIAESLGISVKAIEYHISKIINILRVSLKDYLPIGYLFYCFL